MSINLREADYSKVVDTPSPGVMIAVYPQNPDRFHHPHGDDADKLHCTVGYLGRISELSSDIVKHLHAVTLQNAFEFVESEFSARVIGAGILGEDRAVVLYIESPILHKLHDRVFAELDDHGFSYVEQFPNYIPHVTIGYAADDDHLEQELLSHAYSLVDEDIVFDRLVVKVGNNATSQQLVAAIQLDEILTPAERAEISALLSSADTVWAGKKKLDAIVAARKLNIITRHGVNFPRVGPRIAPHLVKGDHNRTWNPMLHPRGADGRFIHTFGWVKYLFNMKWLRGQVTDIDPDTGELLVKDSKGIIHAIQPKSAYAAAAPKAMLTLPDPTKGAVENALKGWEQIGHQAGSNPGAKFKISNTKLARPLFTPALLLALAARHDPDGDKLIRGKGSETLEDMPSQAIFVLPDGRLIRRADSSMYDVTNGKYLTAEERIPIIVNPNKTFVGGDHKASLTIAKITADAGKILSGGYKQDTEFYVKRSKSKDHAANEILANRLYEAAGVPVPDVVLGEDGRVIGSKIITDSKPLTSATTEELARLRSNFAVDAWLANWDVIGLGHDNVVIAEGVPMRIDAGGALLYRAMGSPKGQMFDHDVVELDTLKNKHVNAQAASVFGAITDDELRDGAARVAGIHPDEIKNLVSEAGLPEDLADKLIARRANLIERTGIEDPYAGGSIFAEDVAEHDFIAQDAADISNAVAADTFTTETDILSQEVDELVAEVAQDITDKVDSLDLPDAKKKVASEVTDNVDVPVVEEGQSTDVHNELDVTPPLNPAFDSITDTPISLANIDADTADLLEGRPVALLLTFGDEKKHASATFLRSGIFEHDESSGKNYLRLGPIRTEIPTDVSENSGIHILPTSYEDHYLNNPLPTFNAKLNTVEYGGDVIGYLVPGGKFALYPSEQFAHGILADTLIDKNLFSSDKQLFAFVASKLLPRPPIITSTKSDAAKSVKIQALHAAKPSYGTLADGTTAVVGLWVESKKDGLVSQIVNWPSQKNYPNLVKVRTHDGVVKYRSLSTLQAVSEPEPNKDVEDSALESFLKTSLEEIKTSPGGVSTPPASELLETTATDNSVADPISLAVNDENLPFAGLKTADGQTPQIGMKVKSGKTGKEVEGILVNVYPAKGWVVVQDETGKKTTKTLATTYVLNNKNADFGDDGPNIPVGPSLAIAAAKTQLKSSSTKVPKAPAPVAAVNVKYPSESGAELPKPTPERVKSWLSNPARKLTKDGYVPVPGMAVRDAKGKLAIVAAVSKWKSQPNSVQLFYPDSDTLAARAASTLHVDHQVSMSDKFGNPLAKIANIQASNGEIFSFPDGTKIFAVYGQGGDLSNPAAHIFYAMTPDGVATSMWITGNAWDSNSSTKVQTKSTGLAKYLAHDMSITHPVAIVDTKSDGAIMWDIGDVGTYVPGRGVVNKKIASADIVDSVEKYKADKLENAKKTAETLASDLKSNPILVVDDLVETFPPPPISLTEDVDLGPELPVITDVLPDFHSVPESVKTSHSMSLAAAAQRMLDHKDSTDPGTALTYALGDSDHVEDMTFRFQVLRDSDTGEERLELRFKLRHAYSQELASKFLTFGGSKGGWTADRLVQPQDLNDGDYLSVRYSAASKVNKLGSVSSTAKPNARVVGTPELYEVKPDGTNTYRVLFVTNDNKFGHLILEDRGAPSIPVREWDPNLVTKFSGTELTPRALEDGWHAFDGISIPFTDMGGSLVDETGAAPLHDNSPKYIGLFSKTAKTLVRHDDDGTSVRWNAVPVVPENSSAVGSEKAYLDRHSFGSEVRISIPIDDKSTFDAAAEQQISRALERLGITPEMQGPPSDEKIVEMALNKLVANFNDTYEYHGSSVTGVEDSRVKQTFARLNKELLSYLPEGSDPIGPDDLLIKTQANGRSRVVFSERVARAMSQRQGTQYYRSSISDNAIINVLSGNADGQMSSDERWSMGLMFSGLSSATDLTYGSGDYVFVRAGTNQQYGGGTGIVYHPDAINANVEIYGFPQDEYGRRNHGDPNRHLTLHAKGDSNERLIKRRIDIEDMAYVVAHNRFHVLEQLKARGITQINGMPIEEFVRQSYGDVLIPSFESPEWKQSTRRTFDDNDTSKSKSIGTLVMSSASIATQLQQRNSVQQVTPTTPAEPAADEASVPTTTPAVGF